VIALLAAQEPVTPTLFLLVVVLLLVKVTIDLAGRTTPVWRRSKPDRSKGRPPVRAPAPRRPPWFDTFAKEHSRWTPPSYWARMLADLAPLKTSERNELITEREAGVERLVQFINFDDDNKNSSA
jgi:hypothetical protein